MGEQLFQSLPTGSLSLEGLLSITEALKYGFLTPKTLLAHQPE